MKTANLLVALLLGFPTGVFAQAVPFDMAPERGSESPAVTAPADNAPSNPTVTPVPPTVVQPVAAPFRRFVVPLDRLALNGESEEKAWAIYLTPEQASTGTTLNVGYQNSIYVAPEISQLTVAINNTTIVKQPISSPNGVVEQIFQIPAGLLKPGANTISFQSRQRHRTDCSVDSTYELWTNIDPAKTFILFDSPVAAKLARLDDIRAVGVDATGNTRFRFIVPALNQGATAARVLRLTQGLALLGNMPNQSFSFETTVEKTAPGSLTILVGTAAELEPIFPSLPPTARSMGTSAFVDDPTTGISALVITGPDWPSIQTLIDGLVSPSDRALDVRRSTISTQSWLPRDTPILFADTTMSLADLGVKTQEFAGRRFHSEFAVAVPSDFYAEAYGEARILLDAAYSDKILPGSHIDVYVNGNIASTVPITGSGGAILRHLPIKVTMRHFRPGVNTVAIDAILMTEEDKACLPGTTGSDVPRFALFNTSEFHIPDFARINQIPNLAALSGTGSPYSRNGDPVPLFIDRVGPDALSAAATFLGKLAKSAGRLIPVDVVVSPDAIGNRTALFIGSISQIPPSVLTQVNIADVTRTKWTDLDARQTTEMAPPDSTFDSWSGRLRGSSWYSYVTSVEDWLQRNFDISLNSLRFIPTDEADFSPPQAASLLVAQQVSPTKEGTWTLVTAPSPKSLREGMTALAQEANWVALEGHVATYDRAKKSVTVDPVNSASLVQSQPMTILNMRLIAANWVSTNILSYAALLVLAAAILGLATAWLLSNFGQQE